MKFDMYTTMYDLRKIYRDNTDVYYKGYNTPVTNLS